MKAFPLGFVSAILDKKSLSEVLEFASKESFDYVELMCWPKVGNDSRRYAGVTHIDVDDLVVDDIQRLVKSMGVGVSGLGYYPNPLDADSQKSEFYVEHIKKVIRACNLLNVPVMNTFIGRNQYLNMEDNLVLFKKIWEPIIQTAEKEGIKIGIENCPMYFTNDEWPKGKNLAISPSVWRRMFEIFPTPLFGLNYDPSHMIFQMMDEIRPIYEFKERLHHIHIKDIKLLKDKLNDVGILANPLEYHSPKLPGHGDVNWSGFISALTKIQYKGPLVLEIEDKDFERSEDDVISAIRMGRDYISQFTD
ncbi:MAG: sugar phosphate isomerase/epimerase family protein [Leadbetterella sp.]